jgi:Cdk activating kinase (CAK)/RNA polymerase II transcription initiation/nucleotide excision repair factor TFIIH/TFIIK, cyclin H subunit
MDYENSTHVRDWNFTTKQLEELRARSNHDAQTFILHLESAASAKGGESAESQQQRRSENETGREGKTSLSSSPTTRIEPPVQSFAKAYKHSTTPYDPTAFQTNPAFITPQEEILLLNFYASKLLPLIGPSAAISKLKRDIKVSSTAALIFKRFYLSNSVLLFDPKVIMVASAFLASKVEDATVDVRYLEDGTRLMEAHVKVKEIVEAEVKLIKGIDFDLCCFHPYKVVLAFTEDLRTFLKSKDGRKFVTVVNKDVVSGEDLRPIYDLARDIIQKLMFTSDVMLMSSPGKIGFVAMILANEILASKGEEHQG